MLIHFDTERPRLDASLASGSGHMDDYDWMNAKQSSGQTIHPIPRPTSITPMNTISTLKAGSSGDNYKAGVTAGYQETRFSWTATGGSYNYDNGTNTGNFPAGERGIGYSQRFSMPYIGLGGSVPFQ